MSDLVKWLRQEAWRNARIQSDKEHQTNRRRKTFRGRNVMLTQAADRIAELEAQLAELTARVKWAYAALQVDIETELKSGDQRVQIEILDEINGEKE